MSRESFALRDLPGWRETARDLILALVGDACALELDTTIATAMVVPPDVEVLRRGFEERVKAHRPRWTSVLDPSSKSDQRLFADLALWVTSATAYQVDEAMRCTETLISADDAGAGFHFRVSAEQLDTLRAVLGADRFDSAVMKARDRYPRWSGP